MNLEGYFEKISEQVMLEVNPYNLAAIYFNTGRRQESRKLADSILLELPDEREWVENLIASDEFIKGNIEESKIWLKRAIETNPKFAAPYWQLGYILLTDDTQRDVLSILRKNRGRTKFDILAYLEFGASKLIARNQEEGQSEFLKAVKLDESGEFALSSWANALTYLGRSREALTKLDDAAKLAPNSYMVHSRWGNALHWLALEVLFKENSQVFAFDYFNKGIDHYRKAIAIDPNQAFAYVGLGLLTFFGGDQEKAMGYYKRAIEIHPSFVDSYKAWSTSLVWRGNFIEAIEKLRLADKYSPNRFLKVEEQLASIYSAWGESLVGDGDDVLALSKFIEATKIYPAFSDAYSGWAGILRRQGKLEEAIIQYEKMSKVGAPSSEAYRNLAEIFIEENNYADAVRRLRTAQVDEYMLRSELPSILAEVHVGWGEYLSKSGNLEAAIKQYEAALVTDAGYHLSYVRWGEALGRAGNQAGKIERCGVALKEDTGLDDAYLCLAQAYEVTNNMDEAISAYERYLSLAPFVSSKSGQARLALMHLRAGKMKRPL